MDRAEQVGVVFPEILIPDQRTNAKKWAVIACDQFTSDKDYWISTTKMVGGSPSSLHIILPEVFLKENDVDERIGHAKETMQRYIEDGVLVRLPRGTVLVERATAHGTRIGLMLAVDLERYEIDPTQKPLIRATEQTVRERIPARMALRENALIECPHVMLLINDPNDTVIAPVYKARGNHTVIYDTPLIQDGGRIKGWFIDDQDILDGITEALAALKKKSATGMLFAVGDGNHSLASAKAVWDEKKQEMSDEARETSPLRYALVEVVNLFDNGLSMHPIHRVLFGVEAPNALRMLVSILSNMGTEPRMMYTRGMNAHGGNAPQSIIFESKMSKGRIELNKPQHDLVSVTLTKALDTLLKELPRAEIDYIHGDDAFHALSKDHGCLGFMMTPMKKEKLFAAVEEYGVLPRKAFSLGSAKEKRYYFECRLLVNADAHEESASEEDADNMPENDTDVVNAARNDAAGVAGEAAASMTVDEPVYADDDPDAPYAPADKKALRKKRQRERKER